MPAFDKTAVKGLQHSPATQDTLFQVYLFSVKPCCCRVAPYAHFPCKADIGGEGWEFLR